MNIDEFFDFVKRDYSMSEDDLYKQNLNSIFVNVSAFGEEKEFLELLKKANNEGKKMFVSDENAEEYGIENVILK
jgi:hypothetical protein